MGEGEIGLGMIMIAGRLRFSDGRKAEAGHITERTSQDPFPQTRRLTLWFLNVLLLLPKSHQMIVLISIVIDFIVSCGYVSDAYQAFPNTSSEGLTRTGKPNKRTKE